MKNFEGRVLELAFESEMRNLLFQLDYTQETAEKRIVLTEDSIYPIDKYGMYGEKEKQWYHPTYSRN